jgi:hypothetical protein
MFTKFESSAIENMTAAKTDQNSNSGQVTITFNGGRDYTYGVADVEQFVAQVNDTIAQGESVGRFINTAIRSEQLQVIAA